MKIKRLHKDAILPTIGTPDSACYDLYALEDTDFKENEIKLVRTGWAIEPPPGWRINLYVRSSTPLKKGFILANSIGICDQDYRGEFFVQLMNVSHESTLGNFVAKGDKIAQFELVASNPAKNFPLEEVSELSQTVRGAGGYGSTGN